MRPRGKILGSAEVFKVPYNPRARPHAPLPTYRDTDKRQIGGNRAGNCSHHPRWFGSEAQASTGSAGASGTSAASGGASALSSFSSLSSPLSLSSMYLTAASRLPPGAETLERSETSFLAMRRSACRG